MSSSSDHLKDSRRLGLVTASNAYAVIHDRKKLWRQMTYREPPFSGNDATEYGKHYEHIALSALEKELGEILEPGNKFIAHPELPLGGSPDFFYNGCPGEIKCPYTQKVYPSIPDRYFYQCQVQMAITNTVKNYFYIWTPEETKLQVIPFSKEFMTWYLPFVLEFMEYVRTDQEPPRFSRKPLFKIGG